MTADSVDDTEPVVIQRWRRFGHDRAYVKQGENDYGYRDLKTGEVVCTSASQIALVTRATETLWVKARAAQRPVYVPRHALSYDRNSTEPDVQPAPARPAAVLLPDRDLATNRPGEAAREQALELRAAAPIHSLVARLVGEKTDERAWRFGADGEEEVARQLAALGPGWHVLHAVPLGDRDSDIDHVVIGPVGVFTVNTKNHPEAKVWVRGDTVKVNGANQHYVRNSRHEAKRAARLLSAAAGFDVEVRGIVAVMGADRGFTVKGQPRDGAVVVVTGGEIARHLGRLEPLLGAPSIDRIFDVARHLSTWQPTRVRREDLSGT